MLKKTKIIFYWGIILLTVSSNKLYSQFIVDTTKNINHYKNLFFKPGSGVEVENFNIRGNIFSVGHFQNYCSHLQIDKGIILSTGNAIDAGGANDKRNSGANIHFKGDTDIQNISKGKTYDAIILEFDFIPNSDSISFDYVFASEEYPEYVNKGLNDAFAFFISDLSSKEKNNLAILPLSKQPVTVDNINSKKNCQFYISNNDQTSCLYYNFQFDGLTTKLTTGYKVVPYLKYHIKIVISDVGDGYYDSAVLLKAHSFSSSGTYSLKNMADTISLWTENIEILKADSSYISYVPDIQFDFNSDKINENSYPSLNNLLNLLKKHFDFTLEINGYADAIGSEKYNKTLSFERADNIACYLINEGVNSNRIKVNGFGSSNPVAENKTEEGRAKNRRVVLKIQKQDLNTE